MQQPRTVVITGSASGIGYGLARAVLAQGSNVMLSDVAGERLTAAAAALGSPEFVGCQPCDVTDMDQLTQLWSRTVERFGRVDLWLNNAGVGPPVIRYDQVPAEWLDRALDVNLRGVMYGTTKAAVRYFSQSLAKELGDCPVRVSWLNPGFVLTPMTIEENLRIRERVGEAQWRKIRWVMNAVADSPEEATPWLVERILRGEQPIDRLPTSVFLRRILASFVMRPDPLGAHGL